MWRGPTVAGQKEASAKVKWKIYGIHSKLIAIAAEAGADPDINHTLADALASARKAGVTSDVIERAIKRGAWLDKDAKKVEEVIYEGYLPGGVAVIVRALTDNRNRTAPSIRHIFSANGGNMGETGSVSNYLFDFIGKITLPLPTNIEDFELVLLETNAQDYHEEGGKMIVITERSHLAEVKKTLIENGFLVEKSELTYVSKNYIEVTDFDQALQIYMFLGECEEDEDIEITWNNAEISDELWKKAQEKVEAKRFRT